MRCTGRETGEDITNRALFYIVQFTWGLPVNFLSGLAYLFFKMLGYRQESFYFSRITYLPTKNATGVFALGIFIFASISRNEWENFGGSEISIHEYGHVCQAFILGPFYWILVAIPSLTWFWLFERYREKYGVSYERLYCESWASRLGKRIIGRLGAERA